MATLSTANESAVVRWYSDHVVQVGVLPQVTSCSYD